MPPWVWHCESVPFHHCIMCWYLFSDIQNWYPSFSPPSFFLPNYLRMFYFRILTSKWLLKLLHVTSMLQCATCLVVIFTLNSDPTFSVLTASYLQNSLWWTTPNTEWSQTTAGFPPGMEGTVRVEWRGDDGCYAVKLIRGDRNGGEHFAYNI